MPTPEERLTQMAEKSSDIEDVECPPLLVNHPRIIIDWADIVVPVSEAILEYIKMGHNHMSIETRIIACIFYGICTFVIFSGIRQFIWMRNRRRSIPKPRKPLVAAIIGIALWFIANFQPGAFQPPR